MKLSYTDLSLLTNSAYLDARKHERNKHTQLSYELNVEDNLRLLTQELYNREWKPMPPVRFIIEDPTIREVFAPRFRDRIVSHLLFNMISPLFERTFIYDSYSCRNSKGTLFGIERFEHNIRSVTNNYQREAYILNLDISGYFMHINKGILYRIICETFEKYRYRKINDAKTWNDVIDFNFAEYLVRSILFRNPLEGCIRVGASPESEAKLPHSKSLEYSPLGTALIIGDLISQLFSNVYLNPFDQYMKRDLLMRWYNRYVDDSRAMSPDKEVLVSSLPEIKTYLKSALSLDLHPRKTTIQSTNESCIFLGACIKPYRRYALNRTIGSFRRSIYELEHVFSRDEPLSPDDYTNALAKINSYLGYLSHFKEYKAIKSAFAESCLNNVFDFTKSYSRAKFKPEIKEHLNQIYNDYNLHSWS